MSESPDRFKLVAPFKPSGDQPEAIDRLCEFIKSEAKFATLLGVTGSGKTYTMANVIERLNRPTIIMSHNKTLAAQLHGEFKGFFPENAVEYFVSYYDYYQPEAYVPEHDLYIEKDASINEEIERLRATSALVERRVREARGQARAIRWERRLHRVLNDFLNEPRIGCKDPLAIHLGAYGRKVFGALRRTRKARPVWRQKAMAKLDNWAPEHGLPPEPFVAMKQAVIALFADMERKGELD